jgi:hypothetical protein
VVAVVVVAACVLVATLGVAAVLPHPAAITATTKLINTDLINTDRLNYPAFSLLDASHATNTPDRSG